MREGGREGGREGVSVCASVQIFFVESLNN